MFLSSLLMNEVSQGSRDIEILRSLFSDLFVGEICNLESKRSNMIQMVYRSNECYENNIWEDNDKEKCVLQEGRDFIALGLMKILGIKGVLLLSTFSLNFS